MEGNNSGIYKKDKICSICSFWYKSQSGNISGFCSRYKQATYSFGFCDSYKESKVKNHG